MSYITGFDLYFLQTHLFAMLNVCMDFFFKNNPDIQPYINEVDTFKCYIFLLSIKFKESFRKLETLQDKYYTPSTTPSPF